MDILNLTGDIIPKVNYISGLELKINRIDMVEKKIRDHLQKNNLKQSDVYNKLGISKQNFYKAIRTKNFDNPSLQKILDFLSIEIIISLEEKVSD